MKIIKTDRNLFISGFEMRSMLPYCLHGIVVNGIGTIGLWLACREQKLTAGVILFFGPFFLLGFAWLVLILSAHFRFRMVVDVDKVVIRSLLKNWIIQNEDFTIERGDPDEIFPSIYIRWPGHGQIRVPVVSNEKSSEIMKAVSDVYPKCNRFDAFLKS
jgi:hypothetical protein